MKILLDKELDVIRYLLLKVEREYGLDVEEEALYKKLGCEALVWPPVSTETLIRPEEWSKRMKKLLLESLKEMNK